MTTTVDTATVVRAACARVGLPGAEAKLIRVAENALYRLPGRVVARVARPGQQAAAAKEVAVSHWLHGHGVPAVRALEIEQPVLVADRAVTFWHELPPHRRGQRRDLAAALRRFHDLPVPSGLSLPALDPFVRLDQRIDGAHTLTEDDRAWMRAHLRSLRRRYTSLPATRPVGVVHGDAWIGNIAVTHRGQVLLLDFERVAVGPPEWDLIYSALNLYSVAAPGARKEYEEFVAIYGYDVTTWEGYTLLRDIREFRMTCTAAQAAAERPELHPQAALRLACIRGERGPRPWSGWHSVS
ncbi:Phosphotransferase enzyme family protein [Streptoalloteichus tenebrarius]|uniref:Phosphotransferase enzyme family protein n=1 Tax=Streptoalloteichus tenebrarius (strain ATCC 17920 / DSM 40477 / JCM 4838 / CBS 697.72 / NBRC 16177 / NCIMB 11028 / NRRL B-12390 / A12253. 1 / ISP 5477) TaxID=1933 RepID=A0ABT1HLV3_STRSD|nr:aminoglycoside phosphotransferase family protein [Streptoalloteichus tenebrarius]MCP2256492.1 Phosphotransferase enzyme family protein [Streptoalloteichus tenebrarius]BFF04844.1 aminoglycoside phosphotransferase family protein [Streptoalloteichus tenebrarius]